MGTKGWERFRGGGESGLPLEFSLFSSPSSGLSWEEHLKLACDCYRREGKARIDKVPTPVRRLQSRSADSSSPKSGTFSAVYEQKSTVDFVGVARPGFAVAIEAKSTSKIQDSWWLGGVEQHQAQYLLEVQRLGGEAGVALFWRRQGVAVWVPVAPHPGISTEVIPPDWCSLCADPSRENPGLLEDQLRRKLSPRERRDCGAVEIPSVSLRHLLEAGLQIPVHHVFDCPEAPDFLPVLREVRGSRVDWHRASVGLEA